jgi:phosphatidylglycerophosphatase A
MNTKTDPASSASKASAAAPKKKPRFAIFLATAAGLGYFPKAPGTVGSLAGLLLAIAPMWVLQFAVTLYIAAHHGDASVFWKITSPWTDPFLVLQVVFAILVAFIGVWAATSAANYWKIKDPQRVVIDEVSGQHLTLLLGCGVPLFSKLSDQWADHVPLGLISWHSPLNWKYLLLGFILFRLFDIWKPFPARQAESLPGGWGIMADDWVAGLYAAIVLWLARAAGL